MIMEIFSSDPAVTFFAATIAIAGGLSLILLFLDGNHTIRRTFIAGATCACFGLASALEFSGTGLLFWKLAFYGFSTVTAFFLVLLLLRVTRQLNQ